MDKFIHMSEEDQINYLNNKDQRKIFIDEYNKNPNFILFCTRRANQKLIDLGFDIASYDEIFMNFEGGGVKMFYKTTPLISV